MTDSIREAAYQVYINEVTANGNTRLDNIILSLHTDNRREQHVATQIDMAFQAGWCNALDRAQPDPVGYALAIEHEAAVCESNIVGYTPSGLVMGEWEKDVHGGTHAGLAYAAAIRAAAMGAKEGE